MHILIAPNAFKHSLTASNAAEAIRRGFQQSALNCKSECFPVGDGGDGTGTLIIEKCGGTTVTTEVHDALGRKVKATFGLIDQGTTAVIEMASASGIGLLKQNKLTPLQASSFGTGELIKHALDKKVTKLIISMGGSATVDGGTGILKALGVRFLNANGKEIDSLPRDLADLVSIDLSNLDQRVLECEIVVLCDVENTLLGPNGAATVFGPQKGASSNDIEYLEVSLMKLRDVTLKQIGKEMAETLRGGTAGGAAAGLHTFLNAKLVNGIDYYLSLTEFHRSLQIADLVITGEGSIDEQTVLGKGPFGVAFQAKNAGIPVIGIAGKVPLYDLPELNKYFNVLLAIGNEPADIASSFNHTEVNLIRTAKQLGNLLALKR